MLCYNAPMHYIIAFAIVLGSFVFMAVGFIFTKKVLKRGCSLDPDSCVCRREGKQVCDSPVKGKIEKA